MSQLTLTTLLQRLQIAHFLVFGSGSTIFHPILLSMIIILFISINIFSITTTIAIVPANNQYPSQSQTTINNNNNSLTLSKYPNIVIILADDMGWGDTTYNNGTAYTPYLDEWTHSPNTITFHRGYAGAPVCSPTRASILSGRTPNRDCIYTANGCGSDPAWSCSEPMPFPNNTFTIAQLVKKVYNNYNTAFFGKWHLGNFWLKEGHESDGICNPGMVGFDYWLATEASAPSVTTNCGCFNPIQNCVTGHYGNNGPWCTSYWYYNNTADIDVSNISYKIPGEDTVYLVDQFEQWLINHTHTASRKRSSTQQLDSSGKSKVSGGNVKYHGDDEAGVDPFLVLLFLHPVHVEFLATEEWRESCANFTTCPKLGNDSEYSNYSSAQLDYFGDLSSMDVQIKRIRDLLEYYNVINNTLIWFTSDNGPEGDSAGPYGSRDWPGSTNGLKGRKRDLWEGDIREPTILQWNGIINNTNGFNSSYPIVTYDLLPTLMELLNVSSIHPTWEIDGDSILNVLKDPIGIKYRQKPMGWQYGSASAWVNDTWKLVINSHDCNGSECEPALYNIENDPFETKNLTDNNMERYQVMMSDLMQWLISVNNSQYYESKCAVKNESGSISKRKIVDESQKNLTKLLGMIGEDVKQEEKGKI